MPHLSGHKKDANKNPPEAVRLAQEALGILRAADSQNAALVAKLLPTYAVQLEKEGVAFDIAMLVEAGRKGPEFLAAARKKREIFTKPSKSYEEILDNLPPKNPYEGYSRDNQFLIACRLGDMAHIQKCMNYNINVHFGDDTAMIYAAYSGNLEIVKLLHEKGVNVDIADNTPLFEAVARGHMHVVEWLLAHGADVKARNSYAIGIALSRDNFPMLRYLEDAGADITDEKNGALFNAVGFNKLLMLKYLYSKGADLNGMDGAIITDAVYGGSLEMLEWLQAQGIDFADLKYNAANAAALRGDMEILEFIHEQGAFSSQEILDKALSRAARSGEKDVLIKIVEWGADIRANDDEALHEAARGGHLDIVDYLCCNGADVNAAKGFAFLMASSGRHYAVQAYLYERGARVDVDCKYLRQAEGFEELKDEHYKLIAELIVEGIHKNTSDYIENRVAWQKRHHIDPPTGAELADPSLFAPDAYHFIVDCLEKERKLKPVSFDDDYTKNNDKRRDRLALAFEAAMLFETRDRVASYLERWGRGREQPLFDLIEHIRYPENKVICNKSWADAILKCGPSMARLLQYAEEIEKPLKNHAGNAWSMVRTRDAVAPCAYDGGKDQPDLARVCLEHEMNQDSFDKALAVVKEGAPAQKNIPDITIQGEKFGMKGALFYRMPANDVRGLYLGQYTDCCQYVGENGEACAIFGYKSPDSGFYVIENARGQIIAQSWAWRGADGALCFDSLETLGHHITPEQWAPILKAIADHLEENQVQDAKPVSRFVVGTGGDTPTKTLSNIFQKAAAPSTLPAYDGYSDAKQQLLIWQRESKQTKKIGREP